MKIVYVYDAIARIGGVEKILADKMNYFADVCAYDIYLITAAQGNHPFSFPISARVKHIDLNARFHLQAVPGQQSLHLPACVLPLYCLIQPPHMPLPCIRPFL